MRRHVLITTATIVVGVSAAQAQAPSSSSEPRRSIAACPSQQELEQVIGSGGNFVPDGCRRLAITAMRTADRKLCVLDFKSGQEPGLLDRLADATVPTQWWVSCADLEVR